jgi:hypothetical protein
MPSSEAILQSLTAIANDWRTVAVYWHVLLGALLIAIGTFPNLSRRAVACLLVLPVVSVSGFAWLSGNPFNGAAFAALAAVLSTIVRTLPGGPVSVAPAVSLVPGLLLVAFGWVYPHFVEVQHWTAYLYAAPLGLLPCPTLSAVIGVTLMLDLRRSKAWRITLAAAGLMYGAIGVVVLGMAIDVGLLAGAVLLAGSIRWREVTRGAGSWRAERSRDRL